MADIIRPIAALAASDAFDVVRAPDGPKLMAGADGDEPRQSPRPLMREAQVSNVLIVYAHPEPRSFNGSMLGVATQALVAKGHTVRISDLYAMHFDPVVRASDFKDFDPMERLDYFAEQKRAYAAATLADDIAAEIEKVAWCDLMILQFPLYWFSVPAILKGWIDRVFVPGFAFGGGAWYERGGLVGKRAMLAMTMAAYPEMMAPDGINGLLDVNLWPIQNGVLAFCGFDVLAPFVASAVPYADTSARTAMLADYGERVSGLQGETPLVFHRREEFDRRWKMKPGVEPRTVGHHFAHAHHDVLQRLR
jgi:NAD(P)H dehydrogenase (quinone)